MASAPYLLSEAEYQNSLSLMWELTEAVFRAQCVYSVVRLGIPDIIGSGTLRIEEMAAKLPAWPNTNALLRCLRNLASVGAVKEHATTDGDFAFSLTPFTAALQKQAPQPSLAPMIEHWWEKPSWGALGELSDYVAGRTSIPPYEAHNKLKFFDFYRQNPESGELFSRNMDRNSNLELGLVLATWPWEKYNGKTVLEIGGGLGRTMTAVAEKFPEAFLAGGVSQAWAFLTTEDRMKKR